MAEFDPSKLYFRVVFLALLLPLASGDCITLDIGMHDGSIPDDKITASSVKSASTSAKNGRLNYTAGSSWCALTSDSNQYLQIDLQTLHIICAVSTQGNSQADQWVRSYTLKSSTDGSTWNDYNKENGQVKFFEGNNDRNAEVKHVLYEGVLARYLRFLPKSHQGSVCMRTEVFGVKQKPENIALGKVTAQSSTFPSGSSDKAVDGNADTDFGNGHCTHTNAANPSWWRVDLGTNLVPVSEIYIVNRFSTYSSIQQSSKDYKITLGGDSNVVNNPQCLGLYSFIQFKASAVCFTNPLKTGRYVGIMTTKAQILQLCEVEIYSRENLAFGKQTNQISVRPKADGTEGGASSRAVDGNSATVFSSGSCTHTQTENKAWWRVDLGQVEPVSEVYIVNLSGPYSFRLDSFEIRVGTITSGGGVTNPKCGGTYSVPRGKGLSFFCRPALYGRYVTIRSLFNREPLTICEVEVYSERRACQIQALGVASSDAFPDNTFSASSSSNVASNGRLNAAGAWSPNTDSNADDYLQIDLQYEFVICAVATQGKSTADEWTTKCKLQLSLNSIDWVTYQENSVDKVFNANSGRNDIVKHSLKEFASARFIRFLPTAYKTHKALRVEVFGILLSAVPSQAPTSFSVAARNSTSIIASWQLPPINGRHGIITGFKLFYNKKDSAGSTTMLTIDGGTTFTTDVSGLEKYTEYEFKVLAFTSVGDGPKSYVKGERTKEDAPSKAPSTFTVTATSSISIVASWQLPPINDRNGIIKGYKLYYKKKHSAGSFTVFRINDIAILTKDVTGLEKYTEYEFQVLAFTSVGVGPKSSVKVVRTNQDAPSQAPTSFSVAALSSTSIKASWQLPPQNSRHGIIRGFKLFYREKDSAGSFAMLPINDKAILTKDVIGLKKYTEYELKVLAFTSAGDGPKSSKVVITKEDAPGAPASVFSFDIAPSKSHGPRINLTWSAPAEANGVIRSYTVFYSHSGDTQKELSGIDASSYSVDVLGGVTYQFHVRAVTIKPGPNASLTVHTKEYAPSKAPTSFSVAALSSTSIKASWQLPPENSRNGIITGFKLFYREKDPAGPFTTLTINDKAILTKDAIGLKKYTEYEFQVLAFTSAGDGPKSSKVVITKEDAPRRIGEPGDPGPKGYKGDKGPAGPPGSQGDRGVKGTPGNNGPKGTPGRPGLPGPPGKVVFNITGPDGPDSGPLIGFISSGSKGPGNIGYIEIKGSPGDPGPDGISGNPGIRGQDGTSGEKGDAGFPGNTGKPGDTGAQGPPGMNGRNGDDGAPGPTGEPGEAGSRGEQGPYGIPGARGLSGIKGDRGEQGGQGEIGDPGQSGETGIDGQPGRRGIDGKKGQQGPRGQGGLPGNTGPVGRRGVTGKPGPEGSAGFSGETGESGAPGTLGNKGDQGPLGMRSPRGSIGKIGPTGPTGQKGENGQSGRTGKPGRPGAKGMTGRAGNIGARGDRGKNGAPGIDGRLGSEGRRGERGSAGSLGSTGGSGDKGNQGPRGRLGPTGQSGSRGKKGLRGRRGRRGAPGETGPKGSPGESGFPGAIGLAGHKGFPGLPGIDGTPGPKGDEGSGGEIGIPGRQGMKGLRGQTGRSGTPGAIGPKGFPGNYGTPGRSGEPGVAGTTGMPGFQGARGITGEEGRGGAPGALGPKGSKGDSGAKGPAGSAGRPGITGRQGELGQMGFQGLRGSEGPPGVQGPMGFAGRSGRRGRKGEHGKDGKAGEMGERGPSGESGNPGPQGPPGRIGQIGSNGEDGSTGAPGPRGRHGQSGRPGLTGWRGRRGFNGRRGIKGEKGNAGNSGLPGNDGKDGRPGEEGRPGSYGRPGFRGSKGKDGFDGIPGRPGKLGEEGLKGATGTPGIPGLLGSPGPIGPRGPHGLKGGTGPKGGKGEQGDLGTKGSTGALGSMGVEGENGDMGSPGAVGRRGRPGKPGYQGAPGRVGVEGRLGQPGRPGIPASKGARGQFGHEGKPGPPGLPGVSGANGEIGQQGKDGQMGQIGASGNAGPKGEQGRGGMPGFLGRPGVRGSDGELGDHGRDGTPGTAGEPRGRGYPGPVGEEGTPGTSGQPGTPGIDGETGQSGEPGESGDEGRNGTQGKPGRHGMYGAMGEPGTKGDLGVEGEPGDIGQDGSIGSRGQSGSEGIKGTYGEEGDTGTTGEKGDTGYIGTQGMSGIPGTEGMKGEPGQDGGTGPSGPKGVVGPQGMPGPQGYSGEEGMIGPQGDHGNHGERGRVGAEGLTGDAGPPGPPGEQGTPGSYKVASTGWIHGSQLQNKGPGFRLYSTKEGESSAELNYLRGLGNVIYFYKSQHGTRLSPARSCRELYLEHPDYPSGNYWIDPNEGCVSDAEHVYCDFEIGASCVFPKNKEVKDPNAKPFQWMSERISDAELINYNMIPVQMRYLRLLSRSVSQNITYNCFNSRAWDDEGRTIKLQGDNEMELTSFERTKPVVLKNECKAADNKWHQTVLEFNTRDKEALPIIDVAPYDINNSKMEKKVFLEFGPVCFFY